MKRRIQELAEGKVKWETPRVHFSQDRIEINVLEGEVYVGTITLSAEKEQVIKGIVYVTNSRIHIRNPQFEGKQIVITYEFDSNGLVEGDIQKGSFYFICNGGEYSLSFVALLSKEYFQGEQGLVTDLDGYAGLAEREPKRALELLRSPLMKNLRRLSWEEKLYIKAFSKKNASWSDMEELLVAVGRKKRVDFTLMSPAKQELICEDNRQEELEIQKTTWGKFVIEVSAEPEWIELEKTRFSDEDFVGSTCRIPFRVIREKLHAGKNFGSITLKLRKHTEKIELTVRVGERQDSSRDFYDVQRSYGELMKKYLDYRLGLLTPALWGAETLGILEHLQGIESENEFLWLMRAQVLLGLGRRQDAEWILNRHKKNAEDKYSTVWAYYLYLTTLLNSERHYLRKVEKKVGEIYKRDEESLPVFWIMLHLDEELEHNKIRKLKLIEQRMAQGVSSPAIYVEAWALIRQEPVLLSALTPEVLRLLIWVQRHGAMTKDVADQIAGISGMSEANPHKVHGLLTDLYEVWQDEKILTAICRNLLRAGIYGHEYYKWFEMGVKSGIHLTNLYEALFLSADAAARDRLPKEAGIYFQYKTSLPAKQKAFWYAGIVNNRDKDTTLYLNCRKEMERFALEQLSEGNIDENLAAIYEELFKPDTLTHDTARLLAKVLYVHKLTGRHENAVRVVVLHEALEKESSFPFQKGVAFIPLLEKHRILLFEDKNGNRFLPEDYELMILMSSGKYVKRILSLAPEQTWCILDCLADKRNSGPAPDDLPYLNIVMAKEEVAKSWKDEMRPALIGFYHDTETKELLDEYIRNLDFAGLKPSDRSKAAELLIQRGFYDRAYANIVAYGCTAVPSRQLLVLCNRRIEETSYEIDDYLLQLCRDVFASGKYSKEILTYLAMYFYGPTRMMAELLRACQGFEMDTFLLQEKLLVQMLYTNRMTEDACDIFESYMRNGGKDVVRDAFLTYCAYQELVYGAEPDSRVYARIRDLLMEEQTCNDCCCLGYLKYVSRSRQQDKYRELSRRIYRYFMLKGIHMKFFQELSPEITQEFELGDRIMFEHRAEPDSQVLLHYRVITDGKKPADYESCLMTRMFDRICVAELIAFFGETIQYYITETDDGVETTVLSGQYVVNQLFRQEEGRYCKINRMLLASCETTKEHLASQFSEYQKIAGEVDSGYWIL